MIFFEPATSLGIGAFASFATATAAAAASAVGRRFVLFLCELFGSNLSGAGFHRRMDQFLSGSHPCGRVLSDGHAQIHAFAGFLFPHCRRGIRILVQRARTVARGKPECPFRAIALAPPPGPRQLFSIAVVLCEVIPPALGLIVFVSGSK